MKRKMIVVGVIALLFCPNYMTPVQANPIAAPQCKDFPSCGVAGIIVGTQIIGGVLYYLVKNAAGAVHKVRSKPQQMPAHRSNQGEDYVGKVIPIGIVRNRETCEAIARQYSRERGGTWKIVYSNAGISTPEGSDGNIPSQQGYYCQIEKQS